jgi:peptidoglycan/LPS O-acetylase OafA/YrhL
LSDRIGVSADLPGSLVYSLQAFDDPELAWQFSVIVPAWTLSVELMFYAIAPFILRRHLLIIAAIAFASQCFRCGAYHFGYYSEATDYRFFLFEPGLW